MKYIYIFILIFFCLLSCKNLEEIDSKEKITFDIPFSFSPKFRGTYFETITKKELIYIVEPFTQKKIFFYNSLGNKVDSVPLQEVIKNISEINAISIRTLDSIILFGSEKIVLINKKGEIKIVNDLSKFSTKTNGDTFMFRFSDLSNFSNSNTRLYVNTSWYNNIYNNYLQHYKIGSFECSNYYYNNYFKNPDLVAVDNYLTDSLKIIFSKENNYKKFHRKPFLVLEEFFLKETENDLLLFSHFSDLILKLDKCSMDCVTKIKIKSDYSTISVTPLEINKENYLNFNKKINEKVQTVASIFDLLYDNQQQKYYVIVAHDFKIKEGQNIKYRPFSILTYNKNFKKIKETKFDYGIHSPYYCLATKKGLLVLNSYKDEKDPKVFTIYE